MKVGVNQMITPVRCFFIIQPDNEDRFRRVMQLAYSIWGGIYSPIIPFYKDLPLQFRAEFRIGLPTDIFYKNTIENYDPDIILYDEDIDEEDVQGLVGDREFTTINQYLEDLKTGYYNHAISTYEVAKFVIKNEFKFIRSDDVQFVVPNLTEPDLLLEAFIGKVSDDLLKSLRQLFEGNDAYADQDVSWINIGDYQASPKIDLHDLNTYQLSSWANKSYKRGSGLYFLQSGRLQDVMNYWNLRAAGWHVVPIPTNLPDLSYFKGVAERFVNYYVGQPNSNHAWITLLIGFELGEDIVQRTFAAIKPDTAAYSKEILFPFQGWFPRFWANYEILDADQIKSHIPFYETFFDHFDTEEDRLRFEIKQVPFESERNLSREVAYKVIFNFNLYDDYAEYAELLSGITDVQLRQLTYPIDFRKWRISQSGIHRSVNRSDETVNITIPKSLEFFKSFFANKAHTLQETPNSRLAKEVLKNIGGLHGARFFLRQTPLKIIEMFEGGKVVSFAALLAELKKQSHLKNQEAKDFIARLLDHKIIELGATVQCSMCSQHGFYLPREIAESITCPICRNQFNLPMEDPSNIVWSYIGIGPFTRTNKADGIMAVFAALRLFHDEFADTSGKITALIGFELSKMQKQADKNKMEIDLGVLLQNQYDTNKNADLLFCECKTYKRFTEKDIERMKTLGDEFPNAVLTVATLNETLEDNEVSLISGLVKYFQRGNGNRPRNPILILTAKELLPEDYHGAFIEYKEQIMPYHRYNDFIGSLCELTVRKHLKIPTWGDLRSQAWDAENNRVRQIRYIIRQLIDRANGS